MTRTRFRNTTDFRKEQWYERTETKSTAGSAWVLNKDAWRAYGNPLSSTPCQQKTVDEPHSNWNNPRLRGGFHGDLGGDFYSKTVKIYLDNPYGAGRPKPVKLYMERLSGSTFPYFKHTIESYCTAPTPDLVSLPTLTERDLNPFGTSAIARCKPTNPVVALFTDFSEFYHEGLPKLFGASQWEHKTSVAKAAGDEYLNLEFGWEPLVSDVKGAAYAAANAHRLLTEYERHSGQVVRRRYVFPIERTRSAVDLGGFDHGIKFDADPGNQILDLTKPQPHCLKETEFYRKTWFSGAFTYHLPVGYHSHNAVVRAGAKASYLYGIELTPDTLWNAAPWTWAIDWVSNAGDVVSNISDWATDGLVMKWGYIMEHQISKVTYSLDRKTRYRAGYFPAQPVVVWVELKRRWKATPFGFGLNWNSFSPRQLAITAALGLSRFGP